jgi:hypothetical protein
MAREARRAVKLYSALLLAESIRLAKDESPSDAVALAAVFVTMHLAWGFGFLFGCLVHGPPTAKRRVRPGPS